MKRTSVKLWRRSLTGPSAISAVTFSNPKNKKQHDNAISIRSVALDEVGTTKLMLGTGRYCNEISRRNSSFLPWKLLVFTKLPTNLWEVPPQVQCPSHATRCKAEFCSDGQYGVRAQHHGDGLLNSDTVIHCQAIIQAIT
jgi:hypothetical protein